MINPVNTPGQMIMDMGNLLKEVSRATQELDNKMLRVSVDSKIRESAEQVKAGAIDLLA